MDGIVCRELIDIFIDWYWQGQPMWDNLHRVPIFRHIPWMNEWIKFILPQFKLTWIVNIKELRHRQHLIMFHSQPLARFLLYHNQYTAQYYYLVTENKIFIFPFKAWERWIKIIQLNQIISTTSPTWTFIWMTFFSMSRSRSLSFP